ncbi:MAG: hypothetical protein ACFB21_11270 [Opitutales bacterium]
MLPREIDAKAIVPHGFAILDRIQTTVVFTSVDLCDAGVPDHFVAPGDFMSK